MNFPFSVPRPHMEALRITRLNPFGGRDRGGTAEGDDRDDRQPLSPRQPRDLEAQAPEMAERGPATRASARFLHRLPRPAIPSFFSSSATSSRRPDDPSVRPSSSRYSSDDGGRADAESPKTPRFTLAEPDLPSTRLHLPNLARTWTQGSNGPPSRPATSAGGGPPLSSPPLLSRGHVGGAEAVTEPVPAVPGQHVHTRRHGRRHERTGSRTPAGRAGDAGDRGGHRRGHRRDASDRSRGSRGNDDARHEGSGSADGETRRRHTEGRPPPPPPKRFLFCFPWIRSRRVRSQILKCFVSGAFLTMLLTIYLALTITKNIQTSEFTVLLILIILFVAIFFCHGLIRLCLFVVRGVPDEGSSAAAASRRGRPARRPQMYGSGGYVIPRQPIRVVLARDEEAAGIESEATKTDPPAYGVWRESVRVDPNRIYWMRNDDAPSTTSDSSSVLSSEISAGGGHGGSAAGGRGGSRSGERPRRTQRPRPPSYVSDDGVAYVVEAQPRSIAPATEVPLAPHPAEVGRAGMPSAW